MTGEPHSAGRAGDSKKSRSLLRHGDQLAPVAVFEFVEREKASHPVKRLCRVLGVSSSGYWAWRKRTPSGRVRADAVLMEEISSIHQQSRQTYGVLRIQAKLPATGTRCGKKRIARLMHHAGIMGCHRRRHVVTTHRGDDAPVAPDLVTRTFAAAAPDRLWAADATQSHYPRDRNIDAGAGSSHHWESGAAEFGCLGRETAGGAPSAVPGRERVMSPPTTIRVPPRPVQNTGAHAGIRFRRRIASGCSAC